MRLSPLYYILMGGLPPVTADQKHIAVTNGSRADLYHHLARLGGIKLDFFDNKWFSELVTIGCFHVLHTCINE